MDGLNEKGEMDEPAQFYLNLLKNKRQLYSL